MAEFWDGKIILVLPHDPSYVLKKVSCRSVAPLHPSAPQQVTHGNCEQTPVRASNSPPAPRDTVPHPQLNSGDRLGTPWLTCNFPSPARAHWSSFLLGMGDPELTAFDQV